MPKLKKDGTVGKVSLLFSAPSMHLTCEAASRAMKGPLARCHLQNMLRHGAAA